MHASFQTTEYTDYKERVFSHKEQEDVENHVLTQSHRVFSRVEVEKWRKDSTLELELQLELI